jgi:hypothetical protein
VLPLLERRRVEDQLGETWYSGTPAPEQQLLALADIMLSRGLLIEENVARRIVAVRSRLEAAQSRANLTSIPAAAVAQPVELRL